MIIILAALLALAALAQNASARTNVQSRVQVQAKLHVLRKQARHSKTVINFWHHRGKWALRTRHNKCWGGDPPPAWERMCYKARRSLATHVERLDQLERQIESLSGPTWCRELSGNRALGCRMAYEFWPSEYEWNALDSLWGEYESGWDEHANNPTSSACGIPQAMNDCAFGYDPSVQILWGLRYIKYGGQCYGSPSVALSARLSKGWY